MIQINYISKEQELKQKIIVDELQVFKPYDKIQS